MKKLLVLSLAASLFTLVTTAQTERPTEVKEKTERRHKGKHEKGMMMKELNLSKEQQAQMKVNHKEMKAKREALKAQDNITVKEMRERKAALKAEQENKMATILTPDQKIKMQEIKKQKKAGKKSRSPKMQARENQPVQP